MYQNTYVASTLLLQVTKIQLLNITVMASRIKHLTSGKRRRFNENGFDLDLTYIKPNIIAMGFPSERLEGLYRNHMDEIVRFFDDRHYDHYKVYNLCSERSYDPSKFHQRVATYPFKIGMPPPFEYIKPCCEDIDEWLKADDRNVACIHCHDGLGRTGVMICSYMVHDRIFDSTKDVLQFFGEARTKNAKGVTLPSQRRYVQYYGHLLKNNLTYSPKTVLIKSIHFIGIPNMQGGTCVPYFTVVAQIVKVYTSKLYDHIKRTDSTADLLLPQELPVCGDVKMDFYHQSMIGKERMFTFWFNTFFIDMHLLQQQNQVGPKQMHAHHKQLSCSTSAVPRQDADDGITTGVSALNKNSSKMNPFTYRKVETESKQFKKALKKAGKQAGVDITTGVSALNKNSSKMNPFTYRKVETESKQFKKALKKAGKQAGVDITTGVTALFPRPHKVTSKGVEKQNPIPTTSRLVSEPLAMGLTNLMDNTAVIIFPRSELDKANKDKKHYPESFQVHLCLLTVGQSSKSVDLNGDYSSEDNDTDLSDTDDEDSWDGSL